MDERLKSRARSAVALDATADLAVVREDLAWVEAFEAEVRHREAHLRALLSPELFRLVWALRDADEQLGLAERRLAECALVERLVRRLSEHEATIRAEARRLPDGESGPLRAS